MKVTSAKLQPPCQKRFTLIHLIQITQPLVVLCAADSVIQENELIHLIQIQPKIFFRATSGDKMIR
ncbi:hypothetical protein A0E43_10575 [Pectobacterium cacticida]